MVSVVLLSELVEELEECRVNYDEDEEVLTEVSRQKVLKVKRLRGRLRKVIEHGFGEISDYLTELRRIEDKVWMPVNPQPDQEETGGYYPYDPFSPPKLASYVEMVYFDSRITDLVNLVEQISDNVKLDMELRAENAGELGSKPWTGNEQARTLRPHSSRVFIVHGHDEEIKQSVARTLEKLGLDVIILHEQANRGKTIIEKFIEYSDVGFALVLLTPDDVAYPKTAAPEKAKLRARQNVVLELGYFLGKLGRERVFVLYREHEDFEIPSDYAGVLYTSYDPDGRWKIELARELKTAGYPVNVSDIFP